jgi:SMODS-associating 4TM effector domain
MEPALNAIPERQNSSAALELMRARQQTYARATRLLIAQFALTVGLPVVLGFIALAAPAIRPYTTAITLLISVVDVTLLDRLQRNHIKLAAKIAESFDCLVLELPWNTFVVGKRPDPEVLVEAERAWRGGDSGILNWYPVEVGKAPLHLARIICQRTNLRYDAALRRHYGASVLGGAALLLVALLATAFVTGMTVEVFIASVVAPAGPVLMWACREYFRQRDTAEAQETVKGDAEALWTRAKTGGCAEDECADQARAFQNAIYTRRAASPLMLPWVYKLRRPQMEDQMNRSASAFLAEIGIS